MENDPVDDEVDAILRNAHDQHTSGCRHCQRAYGILGCQPWSEDPGICTKCAVIEGLVDPENDWNQENKFRPDEF